MGLPQMMPCETFKVKDPLDPSNFDWKMVDLRESNP